MAPQKTYPMDEKTQRLVAGSVVQHLQRTLRDYNGKDVDALVSSLEEATNMIKFVSTGKKKKKRAPKKKAKGKAMTPAEEEAMHKNYMNKLTSHLM